MPRQARLDAPGTLQHVMARGIAGEKIFRDDQDREDFLNRIETMVSKTGTRILAWALMSNHFHLLMFSGKAGVSKFMRCVLTGYAGKYNRRHQRTGHLFQNRYKSIVCEADAYLLELVRYIHLNPVRAGVVRSVEELDRYPWSGHKAILGGQKNQWQDCEEVLGRLGAMRKRAVKAYRRYIEEGQWQGRRDELAGGGLIESHGGWSKVLSMRRSGEKMKHDSRILGGDGFVRQVLGEATKETKRQFKDRERQKWVDRIIREVCEREGVGEEELRGGSQRRIVSAVRAEVASRLSRDGGVTFAEIARQVGVCTTAVIRAVQRWERVAERL